jgi:hypothetical protein
MEKHPRNDLSDVSNAFIGKHLFAEPIWLCHLKGDKPHCAVPRPKAQMFEMKLTELTQQLKVQP